MSEFQEGQKVRLKSGGPVMTVEKTGIHTAGLKDGIQCVWFDDRKDLQRNVFKASMLEGPPEKEPVVY
ncbi:MAG TPA: DUF2158 domain-containing protein [Syntrophorhabdaceae bacterium]|nr:DUF2158 domain-containing protein [Syntrophorhabdaceae bacterium]